MFDFDGDHATLVRPPHKAAATPNNWAKDPSGPGANDGTRITASLINSIVGNLRHLLDAYNISLPGSSDDAVKLAIEAAIQQALENHTFSVAELKDGDGYVRMTDAERAKLAALVANYKGAFTNLAAVEAAYPEAAAGDWAIVMRPGDPAAVVLWDADEEKWVEAGGSPPQTAAQVPFTPAGNIASANVQAALQELDEKKQPVSANLDAWSGIAPSSKADSAAVSAALAGKQDALGLVGIASQAEAEAGSANDKAMTPLRVAQAIAAQASPSGPAVAKAWVNFNGTGTVAIRGSFNVSSITDLGTGTYRVNFQTPLSNANYAIAASHKKNNSLHGAIGPTGSADITANYCVFECISFVSSSWTPADSDVVTAVFFGN